MQVCKDAYACSVMSNSLESPEDCIACHGPLAMRFSRQEYWSRLPFPTPVYPPGHLPNPGIKPAVTHVSCIGRWVL